jgi:hypothetical protein
VGKVVLKETVEDFERSHDGFGQSALKQSALTYFTALRGGFKLLSMSESMQNKVHPFSARSQWDFSPL